MMKPSRLTRVLLHTLSLQEALRPLWFRRPRHSFLWSRDLRLIRADLVGCALGWFERVRERYVIDGGEGASIMQAIEAGLVGEDWAEMPGRKKQEDRRKNDTL